NLTPWRLASSAQAGILSGAARPSSVAARSATGASLPRHANLAGRLPGRGSSEWLRYVERVADAFDPNTGTGFVVLDTAQYLPDSIGRAFHRASDGHGSFPIATDLPATRRLPTE